MVPRSPWSRAGAQSLTGNYVCASDWTVRFIDYAHCGYRDDYASCISVKRNREGGLARTNF
jgi:hypothetical protein